MTYYTPAERKEIKRAALMHSRSGLARHLFAVQPQTPLHEHQREIDLVSRGACGQLTLVEWIEGIYHANRTDTTIAGALVAERIALVKLKQMLRGWSHELMGDAA